MTKLMCGAAVKDITPDEEYIRGLRGLMGTRYGGIHDPLKVRAVAFDNGEKRALIIQPDTDKDQSPVRELEYISKRWNVPQENILYFGIHTHSAPMHTGRRELEAPLTDEDRDYVHECTHKYEELFFSHMHEAIDEAFASLRPCRIGCGKAENYSNVRRVQDFRIYDGDGKLERTVAMQGSDPGAKISHEMFVMRVNDMENKPIAFFMNFPMHCVVMFQNGLAEDGTNLISGDVAGNVSRAVENRFPGAVAVWSSGAAGDVNPIPNSFAAYVDPADNKIKNMDLLPCCEEILKYVTASQFMSIMDALSTIKYYSDLPYISGAVDYTHTPLYRTYPGENGRPVTDTSAYADKTYDIRLQALRIGDALLIGVGGELFNSFAEELKAMSPLKNTCVINHNLSLISLVGYIHDDDALARGYGMRGPGGVNPTVPGCISGALKDCFAGLLESM